MTAESFIYDMFYALAARDGRQEALFGNCQPLAHEAFCRAMVGDAFPEIWFEIPLLGEPRFDFHVLVEREHVQPTDAFPGHGDVYTRVLQWFAEQSSEVRQLALSYDVSQGSIDHPAIQLLMQREIVPGENFLRVACGEQAAHAFRTFAERIPSGWFACYTGLFPDRLTRAADSGQNGTLRKAPETQANASLATSIESPWVRVECLLNDDLQCAYARDPELLADHLRSTSLTQLGDEFIACCQRLANTPFKLEFQFDVMQDGSVGPTVSASVRFAHPPGQDGFEPFDDQGTCGTLMQQVQDAGLADDRWRLLSKTAFDVRAARGDANCLLFCYPAFLKIKWCDGKPVDAKAYLMARTC